MSETTSTAGRQARAEPYFVALTSLVTFHACVQVLALGLSLLKVPLDSPVAEVVMLLSAAAGYVSWRSFPRRSSGISGSPEGDSPIFGSPEGEGSSEGDSPIFAARKLGQSPARESGPSPSHSSAGRWTLPKTVVLLAAATYAVLWVVCYFRPDVSWDGNVYHIPTLHFWARKGYVHWIEWPYGGTPFMNGYPKAVELMGYMMVMALHSSHFVNTMNLAFLPLGVLAVAYLARAFGASSAVSAMAAAAWVLIPLNIVQAPTTYVDSAYASCAAAFLAAVVYVVSRVADEGEFFPFRAVLPLGAAAGLALGAKGTGTLLVSIGLAVLSMAVLLGIARYRSTRRAKRVAAGALFVLSSVALAALVGGFWYARNYAITKSPVYPMGLSVAGYRLFAGPTLEDVVGITANTAPGLRALPGYQKVLLSWAQAARGGAVWDSWLNSVWSVEQAWGYLWLAGCLPATAWLLVTRLVRRQRGTLALFALAVVVAGTFLVQPMNWKARFSLWIYALGLPCFAVVAERVWKTGTARPRLARPARFWLAACVLVLMFEGVFTLTRIVPIALRPQNTLSCLKRHYWGRPVCYLLPELSGSVFDDIFTGSDTVALGSLGERTPSGPKWGILGQLSLPLGRRNLLRITGPLDEAAVAQLLARKVKYVILDEDSPLPDVFRGAGFLVQRPPGFLVITLRPFPRARSMVYWRAVRAAGPSHWPPDAGFCDERTRAASLGAAVRRASRHAVVVARTGRGAADPAGPARAVRLAGRRAGRRPE